MANNWKYYQQTGLQGGIALILTERTIYIDSHNGDDVLGDGSHDNPYATPQSAADAGSCDMIVAGVFAGSGVSGDLVGGSAINGMVAEGDVFFNGTGIGSVSFGGWSWNSARFQNPSVRYTNGRFIMSNYTTNIGINVAFGSTSMYDAHFFNCTKVQDAGGRPLEMRDIFLYNSKINDSATSRITNFTNITAVNGSRIENASAAITNINGCNLDTSSTLNVFNVSSWDHNFFEGTLTNKITVDGVSYDNIEAVQVAHPTFGINDLPSTTVPLYNLINVFDYTLQEGSPLQKAASDGGQIGTFKVAKAIAMNDAAWTIVTGIDNTTVPGTATLSASPIGTMESIGFQISVKKRKITRINMPNAVFNSPLGEMIGNLASDNTPYLLDIEMQHSLDDITYNGTWLRMAIGVPVLDDTLNNVGTDDGSYDINEAEIIVAKYIKLKATLRNNETPI